MSSDDGRFDAVVIGSGIGGLAAAASLAKCGRRVLVLEQHFQLGGLTQAFTRQDYTFATGVHYIGGVGEAPGPDNQFGRLLRWLTDGRLRFASIGSQDAKFIEERLLLHDRFAPALDEAGAIVGVNARDHALGRRNEPCLGDAEQIVGFG